MRTKNFHIIYKFFKNKNSKLVLFSSSDVYPLLNDPFSISPKHFFSL